MGFLVSAILITRLAKGVEKAQVVQSVATE
jgi:hypothetical protein